MFLKFSRIGKLLLQAFAKNDSFPDEITENCHFFLISTFNVNFTGGSGQYSGVNIELLKVKMKIAENIKALRKQMEGFPCRLVAISKTKTVDEILEAYHAGQRIFGENKVQELTQKCEQLPADIEWHMVGHLQTNKVKYIAPFVALIHSVDSLKLLKEIDKQARNNDRQIHCLLQVHIAEEETKFGFSREEVFKVMQEEALADLHHIRISGLMGMATFTENMDKVRREFRFLKSVFDEVASTIDHELVKMKELSMGMTGDYQVAMEEGSTFVRIGTAVFGERNPV
jgi:pyridoxal phosphate enzyme (YggS family)